MTKLKPIITGVLSSTLFISSSMIATASADDPVAIVNGKTLTQQDYNDYLEVRTQQGHGKSNSNREIVLEELIQRQLLLQKAHELKINETAEFQEKINTLRDNLLMSAVVENYLKENSIDDTKVKQEYDKQVAEINVPYEYKAQHILVKSQEQAQKLTQELKQGGSFAMLAEKYSIDTGSAKEGGELGWITESNVVAEFGTALKALEKGHYTTEPVKTKYGWHIIKLDDKRHVSVPPFEKVQAQIRMALQNKQIQDYLEQLTQQAKIQKFEMKDTN
jgi:peptidyl-prolyl cis-trans isomerase C